ncbi:hypothetical protein CRE_02540 [Caenorhabditis remanei]|uniref:G-protein coupled receptors family 1 profile domain-containing protein n=1 Tax=Caenorhabditis remanei TaxID=31234 RepID=E3MWU3_CAERE|nr:hypothetical protein CRE_02540 [Caenorhabditis remanei]
MLIVTYILALILQVICALVNGVILCLFVKLDSLLKNKHLRLVLYLSVAHFLDAILGFPYIIYMTKNWDPIYFELDPLFILVSEIPVPIGFKFSATATIGVALSRCMAVFSPGTFRKIEKICFSEIVSITGFILGMFDACLSLALSPITRIPNCGTAGCFLSNQFLYYWGISNMIFGFIVIILSITLLVKIQLMDGLKALGSVVSTSQEKRFQQVIFRTNY